MIERRALLGAAAFLPAAIARGQSGLWPEWIGSYDGAARFYRSLAVFLADTRGKFTFPDGKTEEFSMKPGQTMWAPAQVHLPENLGNQPFELDP